MKPEMSQEMRTELADWASAAVAAGWLENPSLSAVAALDESDHAALFDEGDKRPLLVAFFGGTGAGKSSLLNRLAGQPLAKTGVQRPTSNEVSIYLHQEHQLNQAFAGLPMDKTRVRYHDDTDNREIAWLDMPDVDSVEQDHRELVEQWLPYIDWLVYVVTPERYLDDAAWQILQTRKDKHHWLFVMNHWDVGHPDQLKAFREQLDAEGLSAAPLLRTSSTTQVEDDEFEEIRQTLVTAIDAHGVDALKNLGVKAQLLDIRELCARFQQQLGTDAQWHAFLAKSRELIEKETEQHSKELLDEVRAVIEPYRLREEERAWWRGRYAESSLPQTEHFAQMVSGERQQSRLQNIAGDVIREARNADLPFSALHKLGEHQYHKIAQQSEALMRENISRAMATPGNPIQRALYRLCRWLTTLLPLAAAMWAGWFLVSGYYGGTRGELEFPGINFAVSSLLLVGLTWFVPWMLSRLLRPSLIQSLYRGCRAGIDESAAKIKHAFHGWLEESLAEKNRLLGSLNTIQRSVEEYIADL